MTIELYDLALREDRGEWVVGRVDTGVFVAVPVEGAEVIRLLRSGRSVADVSRELPDCDVADFVDGISDLGFVRARDGGPVDAEPPPRSTLTRLREEHVRWLRRPAVTGTACTATLAAVAWVLTHPADRPRVADLVATGSSGVAVLALAAATWMLLAVHELGHLAAARAYGAPGRIRLGTRLQFLVVQTDVSSTAALPLRARLFVYAAGTVAESAFFPLIVVIVAVARPAGLAGHLLGALVWTMLGGLAWELLVFMRTDVYYVLRDLTGCRDLSGDGWAYVRWLARRRRGDAPLDRLPRHERRAVRLFAVILVVGSAACLALGALVSVPATVRAALAVLHRLIHPASVAGFLDAALAGALGLAGLALWAFAWTRQHPDVVRRLRRRTRPREEVLT